MPVLAATASTMQGHHPTLVSLILVDVFGAPLPDRPEPRHDVAFSGLALRRSGFP